MNEDVDRLDGTLEDLKLLTVYHPGISTDPPHKYVSE